ncbi:hypothetical protein Tco_1454503, partial [Tanacetum coccineum]
MVAYLQKSEGSEGFHQIVDFLTTCHIRYALTESPAIYVSLIEKFWHTATASTLENGDMEITVTIDGKVKVVSEASIRRHLKLEDSDGISDLPTTKNFEQLALMGSKKTAWEQFSSNIATAIICFNFSKLIFVGMAKNLDKVAATMPHDSPLPRVYLLRSDEGSMTLHELTVLCTTLSKKVESLESNLKQTKLTYGAAYTKLIIKVKKLENRIKSSKARRRGRHVHEEFTATEEVYTTEPDISTANVPVSTAGAEVSTASTEVKTAAESLVYNKKSATKRKDKGRAIMKEVEPVQKKTKLQLEQERLGYEEALRLQEQLDEEERQRIARVHKKASTFNAEEWDNIQAQ